MSMRRQMQCETWAPESGLLIDLAAAAYFPPCRQVVVVAEQHTLAAQNHQTMVIK